MCGQSRPGVASHPPAKASHERVDPKLRAGFTPWKFWIVMPKKDGGIVGSAEVPAVDPGRVRSTLTAAFSRAACVNAVV
jgi:hypothetical protein